MKFLRMFLVIVFCASIAPVYLVQTTEVDYTDYVMAYETFEQSDISLEQGDGGSTEQFNITTGTYQQVKTVPSPSDKDGTVKAGNSLMFQRTSAQSESSMQNAFITYKGEGIESLIAGRMGLNVRVSFEMSIMANQTNVDATILNMRHGTSGAAVDFLRFNRTGQIVYVDKNETYGESLETLIPYETGKWYHVRLDFDTRTKLTSCYVDGEPVLEDREMVMHPDFLTKGVYSLNTVINTRSGNSSQFWIDDIKLTHHVPPPFGEIVVDQTGENGAYTTIQAAMDAADAVGTTVLVKDGIYYEDVVIKNRGSKYGVITLKAEGDGAIIKGKLEDDKMISGSIFIEENAPYIVIDGLRMDGSKLPDLENPTTKSINAITINAPYCSVINTDIRDYVGFAIMCPPSKGTFAYLGHNYMKDCLGGFQAAGDSVVEHNEFAGINNHRSEVAAGDIFRIFGNNTTFRNNYSHGTKRENLYRPILNDYVHSDVLQSWDDIRVETSNILIENNVFLGYYHQGLMLENDKFGRSEGIFYIHDWTVRNNIFSGFSAWAICGGKLDGGIPNMVIENNVFATNYSHYGVGIVGLESSAYVRNNIFVGCTVSTNHGGVVDSDYNLFYPTSEKPNVRPTPDSAGAHDMVNIDPLFTRYHQDNTLDDDPETMNDYRPTAFSPGINRGTDTTSANFDFDKLGNPRKYGMNVDLGPYEYQGEPEYVDTPPQVTQLTPSYTAISDHDVLFTAQATDDAFVQKVEFLVDDVVVGTKFAPDTHGGNIYTFAWKATGTGEHEITAKAYDGNGNFSQSEVANVAVKSYTKRRVNLETFDDDEFSIDGSNSSAGSSQAINSRYAVSRQSFDRIAVTDDVPNNNDGSEREGKSLYFYRVPKLGETSGSVGTPSQLRYTGDRLGQTDGLTLSPQTKFSLEMEFFLKQKNTTFRPFSLNNNNNPNKGTFHLLGFHRTGNLYYNESSLSIPYDAGVWHKVRLELDFESNIITAIVNDNPVMRNVPIGFDVDFSSRGADYLDTMLHFAVGQSGEIYIDNIELSVYEEKPPAVEWNITKEDGNANATVYFNACENGEFSGLMVLAHFEDDRFINLDFKKGAWQNGRQENLTIENVDQSSDVRLFVWEDSMIPIIP